MRRRRHFHQVRGYRLEVPAAWDDLTARERARLQNGIGPDAWPAGRRRALDDATGFRGPADIHDVDYCVGRTRLDRLEADRRFRRNCLRVVWADAGGWLGLLLRAPWRATAARALAALGMYRALRLGGERAFEAATKVDIAVRGSAALPPAREEGP